MTLPGRDLRLASGFTLVELMVVLAIVSALLVVALPAFTRLYASVRVSLEREDLERQLLALPQQARLSGHNFMLADPAPDNAAPAPPDDGVTAWQVRALDLPDGWSMTVPKPIFYHFTGACDGGQLTFFLPPLSLSYVLTAPLCRPRLADASDH